MQARIPDVTLFEELGRGYGGIVHRAVWRGAACTVKLPNTHDAAARNANPFHPGALYLAPLAHTALPRVHHVDTTDKPPYAILDDVEGRPLLELLETQL